METFTFRISADMKAALAEIARQNERSPGAELRYALKRHLILEGRISPQPYQDQTPWAYYLGQSAE